MAKKDPRSPWEQLQNALAGLPSRTGPSWPALEDVPAAVDRARAKPAAIAGPTVGPTVARDAELMNLLPGVGAIIKTPVLPQATQTAYKLFRVGGTKATRGNLYPLFVKYGMREPIPRGEWLRAEAGPPGKKPGKVASSLGDLAYRPGWHAGDYPVATHIGGSIVKGQPPVYRPKNQVWAEVDLAADKDWQTLALARAERTKEGLIKPQTAHITDQVPYEGFYRYKTNPNMTGEWLIGGDMKVKRILTDEEVAAINAAGGFKDLPRQHPLDLRALGLE